MKLPQQEHYFVIASAARQSLLSIEFKTRDCFVAPPRKDKSKLLMRLLRRASSQRQMLFYCCERYSVIANTTLSLQTLLCHCERSAAISDSTPQCALKLNHPIPQQMIGQHKRSHCLYYGNSTWNHAWIMSAFSLHT